MKKLSVSDAWVNRVATSGGAKASPERLGRFQKNMRARAERMMGAAATPVNPSKASIGHSARNMRGADQSFNADFSAVMGHHFPPKPKRPSMGMGGKAALGVTALGLGAYGVHKMMQPKPVQPAQPTPPTQPIQKMGAVTLLGFADELEKISGVIGKVVQKGTRAVEKGWEASGGWAHGRGRIARHMPGGKALTIAGAAASLPGAIRKEDPSGKGRSRTERMGGVAMGTLAGLAGSSAPGMKGMVGGMAAGVGGEWLGGQMARRIPGAGRQAPMQQQQAPQMQRPVPSAL